MFGGNLASIAARQARTKKIESEGKETKSKSDTPLGPPATPESLKFTKEAGAIPREVLLDYLNTCTAMLLNPEHIRMCIHINLTTAPEDGLGLHQCLMEFQKQVMENNFGIERNFGCQYMSMIPTNHPDDVQLHASAKRFMFICMRAYVNAIKMRYKENYEGKIEPRNSGELPRHDMLEFCEACNALMTMPETKKMLKEVWLSTGQTPNNEVMELQRSVFRDMNYDVDFACSKMDEIPTRYGSDMEVINKMQQFQIAAELACREAGMTEEERKRYYENIPPFMHHFPHMWVWTQRRQMMQQQQQQRAEMAAANGGHASYDHNHDHGHSHSHGHDHDHDHNHSIPPRPPQLSEEQQQWMRYINSPEGQANITQLGNRIKIAKATVEPQVKEWDLETMLNYFDSHGSEVPRLMKTGIEAEPAGSDTSSGTSTGAAIHRLEVFSTMPPADLEKIVTLQSIVQSNLITAAAKTDNVELKGRVDALTSSDVFMSMRQNLMATPALSSSGNMYPTHPSNIPDHGHSHDHSHSSSFADHDNPDPRNFYSAPNADVTKGKVETMDR